MANVNTLLNERLKKGIQSPKMAAMAQQTANGNMTSFSGVFGVSELNAREKGFLEELLQQYASDAQETAPDLKALITITSEVKAINNQAALLHGERIKQAQRILTKYQDGAFTSWLIAAYGNRQTPYNFLQYYELCDALPKILRPLIEEMPRQAIYTLASRAGPLKKKQEIIEQYKGETKTEILRIIRDAFPLRSGDRRRQNMGDSVIQRLTDLCLTLKERSHALTKRQKSSILQLLDVVRDLVN